MRKYIGEFIGTFALVFAGTADIGAALANPFLPPAARTGMLRRL